MPKKDEEPSISRKRLLGPGYEKPGDWAADVSRRAHAALRAEGVEPDEDATHRLGRSAD